MKIDDFRDKYKSHIDYISIKQNSKDNIAEDWGGLDSPTDRYAPMPKSDALTTRPLKSVRKGEQITLFKLNTNVLI